MASNWISQMGEKKGKKISRQDRKWLKIRGHYPGTLINILVFYPMLKKDLGS